MTFKFQIGGRGFRYTWQKDCQLHDALVHAGQVAGECARDEVYHGASVRVMEETGKDVAVLPVSPATKKS